jgi:diguanylate cyclase (GGDEF)-like protein
MMVKRKVRTNKSVASFLHDCARKMAVAKRRFQLFLQRIHEAIDAMNDYERTFTVVALFALFIFVDFMSGRLPLTLHLYYIPILGAAWYLNRKAMLMLALLTSARLAWEPVLAAKAFDFRMLFGLTLTISLYWVAGHIFLAMRQLFDKEHQRARLDFLTGVLNNHGFFEVAREHFNEIDGRFRPFSMLYIDLDRFKQLNDTRGHLEADRALKTVGAVLRQSLRRQDTIGRLGGDEFVVLLPGTSGDMAGTVSDRLRRKLDHELMRRGWDVTASVGCVAFHTMPESVQVALQAADDLMYQAKKKGRSQSVFAVWENPLSTKVDRAAVVERLIGNHPSATLIN